MAKIPRIIPVLLYHKGGLYKTVNFKKPSYVGDPINAIKVFNEKEVDELILLDIDASVNKTEPDYNFISKIVSECFMPLCYGGGIQTLDQIQKILRLGVEKVAINHKAVSDPKFIKEASDRFGSSTIVVSIDYKKDLFGNNKVYVSNGKVKTKYNPKELALLYEEMGTGELLLNSISRDGKMRGYDLQLINEITESIQIPLIACGGAGQMNHFAEAIKCHASAVAAGSMFVFYGYHKAVLINYPSRKDILNIINNE
jgi:cyclase